MKFIKTNNNPKGFKVGDCVIRTISLAENKKWIDTYKDLCALGVELSDMPNSKRVYEEYLKRNGWLKQPMPKKDGKRMKLKEFTKESTERIVIANIRRHLTIVCPMLNDGDGELYDTWDCSEYCVGNYWIK